MRMNICPYCPGRVNPLRLLVMTRRFPYRCARCGGRSLLRPKQNTIAGLLTLVGILASMLAALPDFAIWRIILGFALYFVAVIGGAMWFFMQLQPVKPTV